MDIHANNNFLKIVCLLGVYIKAQVTGSRRGWALGKFQIFYRFFRSSLLMLLRVMHYRAWVTHIPLLYILIYIVWTDLSSRIVKGTDNSGWDRKIDICTDRRTDEQNH